MQLRIKGTGFTENVFAELSALTDRATLRFKDVNYKKEDKVIFIPIERYAITGRSKFFGTIVPYKIDKSARIKSLLTIKNVVDCEIVNNIDDPSIFEVTILFGVKVKGKQIYVCSAEETRGVTCYSIDLAVNEVEIEIEDEELEGPG